MPNTRTVIATLSHLAIIMSAIFSLPLVQAVEYNIDLFSSAESSNDALKDGSSRSELETAIGLGINVNQDGRRVDYTGDYRVQYSDFANDTNQNRTVFDGSSEFIAALLPQRLDWLASHSVSDVSPSRRAAADISDDRQQRHQFSTGPFATLPVTPVDQVTVSATYTEVLVDEAENAALNTSEADSQSVSAGVNWLHSLSQISSLVGGYQYQQFERDNATGKTDFERVYLGYTRSLRTLEYSLNLGSNTSKREGQSSSSGFFYQADVSKTSGNQTFSASASRQRTESSLGINPLRTSTAFSTPEVGQLGVGQTRDNANIAGVVDITFFNADYTTTAFCKLCSYGAEFSFTESDFETAATDDDRTSDARVFYNYRLTPRLTAGLAASYSRTEFLDLNQQDTGNSGSFDLRWQASPRLNVAAIAGYEEEDSDTGSNFYNAFGRLSFSYNLAASNAQRN